MFVVGCEIRNLLPREDHVEKFYSPPKTPDKWYQWFLVVITKTCSQKVLKAK